MTTSPAGQTAGPAAPPAGSPPQPRRRDAARTRQLLLDAARHRFTHDGYAATTLRDIADDVGVNVALISRYFESKEGLFTACLTVAVDEFRRTAGDITLDQVPLLMADRIVGSSLEGKPGQLMLLLRSSGDERADQIRLGILRGHSEQLAAAAGWRPGEPDDDQRILRAQLVLAATTGIMVLRHTGLQPLASTPEQDLVGPLRDLVNGALAAPPVTEDAER